MVLCLDVFEANWAVIAKIAGMAEDAAKTANALYQKVSMVLCVLRGMTCDLMLCFLTFVWTVSLHLVMSPPTHLWV